MGLLSTLLLAPVSGPLKGTSWVANKIYEAADQEFKDPATIKLALSKLEQALLAGEISEDTYDDLEEELLLRLRAIGR